jgi:polygalacturonase
MKCKLFVFLMIAGFQLLGYSQNQDYKITDFGAVSDGITLCTESINKAITTCAERGGGTVIIPPGKYKSGTIVMKDNVNLHLEIGATLLASTNHNDFPRQPQPEYRSQKDPGGWFALIYAEGASNIAISGYGIIDGNGADQTPIPGLPGGDRDGRPRNLLFISCKQVRVEGIRMRNSGLWNQHYLNCEDVLVDRVEVYNHSNKNNDAIDIDGCRRFVLSNSILDSDDDCITLKSTGMAATEDVVITNCIASSFCNAIKAGTESTGGFRNISISNCVIKPSRYIGKPVFTTSRRGITGISLEIVDGGTMEGVSINNITIEGTQCPLYFRLGNRARKHTEAATEPGLGTMRNISVSNITAYDCGNLSSSITAIPGCYIENVILSNIELHNEGDPVKYPNNHMEVKEDEKGYPQPGIWGNLPSSVFFIRHVKNLAISNLMFSSREPDPRVPVIAVDVHNLQLSRSIYTGTFASGPFILLDQVTHADIEKPLNWPEKEYLRKL